MIGWKVVVQLIVYIDDATNEVMGAIFRQQEDAAGYFLGLKDICPRHSLTRIAPIFQGLKDHLVKTFLIEKHPPVTLELFKDLGIELKAARSPQAKGRIEVYGVSKIINFPGFDIVYSKIQSSISIQT